MREGISRLPLLLILLAVMNLNADALVTPSERTHRSLSSASSLVPTSRPLSSRRIFGVVDESISSTSTQLYGIPTFVEVGVGLTAAFGAWLYIDGADDRARNKLRNEENARYEAYQAERARKAYIEPQEYWTLEEIAKYNGYDPDQPIEEQDHDEYGPVYDGPILLAADGLVFNVWKGRNFYGPGGEYHMFAGRDATRLLAKTIVREETDDETSKPLNIAERAALAGWMFTLKNKYEVVGKLQDFDPSSTAM